MGCWWWRDFLFVGYDSDKEPITTWATSDAARMGRGERGEAGKICRAARGTSSTVTDASGCNATAVTVHNHDIYGHARIQQ